MLPSCLVSALWLAVALALPLLRTLHELRAGSPSRKLWLGYWMCYAAGMRLLQSCEPLAGAVWRLVPFADEARLLAVLFLVLPRTRGLARLQESLGSLLAEFLMRNSALALGGLQRAAASAGGRAPKQDTLGEAPGTYCIVAPAAVTSALQPTQETIIKQLDVGQTVEVLSVVRDGPRLRARVREPAGWISLLNAETGKRWAQSCEGTALEGRGLEDGLAAAAAAVGADPAALFGNIGQAAGKRTAAQEADPAAAWEAVALLESQLARADDPSEEPGVRQASGMLRSMLATLASGGNPAALTMAQVLVPDIGTIWAHEGTRDYLRALLGAGGSDPGPGSGGGATADGAGEGAGQGPAGGGAAEPART